VVEAQFVLHSLLGREDLEPGEARSAVARSLEWLAIFGGGIEASYVLSPLLGREDLESGEARSAVARAIEWLKAGHQAGEDFVLKHLLSRSDLSAGDTLETHLRAADYVRSHPLESEASFMLKQLLSRKDLAPGVAQAVVESGVTWFEANTASPNADFVFTRLLRRPELQSERRLRVMRLGIAWLRQAPARDDRDFALNSLLWNAGLLREDDRQFLAQDISDWLARAPRDEDIVMRLETGLREVARNHPEEPWATTIDAGLKFRQLTRELAERVRDPASVPTEEWLKNAIDETERTLEGARPGSAGYALPCLLPLVARSSDEGLQSHVGALVKRFLDEGLASARNRYGFALACYRLVDEGCWRDPGTGEEILASLGVARPLAPSPSGLGALTNLRTLEKQAVELAESASPLPSPSWLDLVLVETAKPIERGFPKAAGFLFPPLLALAARFGSAATREVLAEQIRALLADPSFSANGRRRFSLACYRFVDEGAWPDGEEGEQILVSLGIERPAS
jgi:hypothetical protein